MGITKQLSRKKFVKKTKPVYLIICEGKTEILYFQNFKKRENTFTIEIKEFQATDPKSMINKTNYYIKKLELSIDDGDKAFCLIDLDNNENKAKLVNELKSKNKGIEIITSNPTFEIWYLLHFIKNPKVMNSKDTIKELKKNYIINYEKNINIYKNIKEKTSFAIKNSKKLRDNYKKIGKDINTIECNPCTEVDILVKIIKQL